ncbi:MAG: hypothetical protein E8D46_14355 [Nitrospira sp.]|nr:MAG: hypothetical protein E8D46_14355 [Nitrospira sp.]
MNWKIPIACLLLPLMCWVSGITPLWTGGELAEHYVLSPEGSHCNEICVHPSSPINPPQVSATLDIPFDESAPHERLTALLPHPHAARDRPPPLFYSLSHSLRAPPTLILA